MTSSLWLHTGGLSCRLLCDSFAQRSSRITTLINYACGDLLRHEDDTFMKQEPCSNVESSRDGTGLSCCVQSLMLQLLEPSKLLHQGLLLALVGRLASASMIPKSSLSAGPCHAKFEIVEFMWLFCWHVVSSPAACACLLCYVVPCSMNLNSAAVASYTLRCRTGLPHDFSTAQFLLQAKLVSCERKSHCSDLKITVLKFLCMRSDLVSCTLAQLCCLLHTQLCCLSS